MSALSSGLESSERHSADYQRTTLQMTNLRRDFSRSNNLNMFVFANICDFGKLFTPNRTTHIFALPAHFSGVTSGQAPNLRIIVGDLSEAR